MNGVAVPAKTTAFALGVGLTMTPSVTSSAIDGLVVGALLWGVCCLAFVAWRRGWLSRPQRPPADNLPDVFLAAPVVSPFDVAADEKLEAQDSVSYGERVPDSDCLPARSRHGLEQKVPITWRSLLAPTAPRHAAPSPIIAAVATGIEVLTTKFAVRPLPVRN